MLIRRSFLPVAGVTFSLAAILFSSSSAAATFCDTIFASVFVGITNHETRAASHFVLEKGLHLTLFTIFGLLLMHAVRAAPARRIAAVFLSGVVVGAVAEYLQTFFAGRDPAIRDVLIDAGGTCIGIAISLLRPAGGPLQGAL